MTNTQTIANSIIKLSLDSGILISPMKLQKLIYFVYKDFLKKTRNPLFSERFEKWKYGPVLPSVYYEFSPYGSGNIIKFARDAMGGVTALDMRDKNPAVQAVNKVWCAYKNYDAITLSQMTHSPGSAWDKARKSGKMYLEDEDIMNESDFE